MSGGAGYVLSRGALKSLVQVAFKNNSMEAEEGAEDVQMGNSFIYKIS